MSTSLFLLIWVVFTAYQSKCFALMLLLSFFGGGFFFFFFNDGWNIFERCAFRGSLPSPVIKYCACFPFQKEMNKRQKNLNYNRNRYAKRKSCQK